MTPVVCDHRVLHDPQAVLEAALEAYVAIDSADRVLGWNTAAEALFGYSHAQACGRAVADLIIPERYREQHRAGLARTAAGEPGRVLGNRLQLAAVHRDGHEFPIEMTLTITTTPDGPVFHAFAYDVSARVRAARFTGVEAAVSRGLAEASSSDAASARVTEALGRHMGWPVVELWLTDLDRQLLVCTARYAEPGRLLAGFAVDELDYGIGLPGRVYLQRRSAWVPDLAADATLVRSRAAAAIGLHVAVGVPVWAGGRILGALCVFGDRAEEPEDTLLGLLSGVAAHVGQYLERRRTEELAIELARTKDEFLAMVTHELRNPLTAITATATVLSDEADALTPPDLRHYLGIINRNALRLTVMAEDLLDLSRLESGHMAIHPTDCDLTEVVNAAIQDLTEAAVDKNLTVTVTIPPRLPLHADPDRLRQVADNLLSNAIKYTPAGGTITVTADTRSEPDSNGKQIVWSIADTGIGIPAADRPRLFRRFYRASSALDRRIPGTGLGLVIVRTILERHHGTITLADHQGPGTTFVIELPTEPLEQSTPPRHPQDPYP
ncbi:PAS domain-containing sensor histidine kinase [Actinoplanes sp. NEAU-A12]|uniref:histidine kinase n=1 Tax=Actinoplanes sandaracinus TaxID=3045177 RepID=A0ABT6WX03_9ACTN|nr:PAS domain-containing sensor histidine kinase [Actinoplanes sandaracinus]MDI6104151.1 PAS domain-containing sensor histidine kinase [Actinoplanes sandaracinus]